MSEREPDFEFDFFEEPETREAQGRERTLRRPLGGGPRNPRGPDRPPLRPAAGFAPLLRLIGLIAFAILIVVLLVLWAQSCQEDQRRDTYRDYVNGVAEVARQSEQVGRRLNDVLTTQAIEPAELDTQLTGLVQRQTIIVSRQARGLDPPGPLRTAHEDMIEALEFRVDGLDGLAAAFRRTRGTDDEAAAGALLVPQVERLVASDVIWDDLFVKPTSDELREQEVTGVEVPDSNFVQTPDLASRRTVVQIWQRINGKPTDSGGTGAGLHGNSISSVTVLPAGTQLAASAENTIVASTDLAFRVAVENTGDNQEVDIEVTLTIQQTPAPVTKTQKIDIINPGEVKSVTFRNFPSIDFGEPRTLRVDVEPVPQEARVDNNSREYRVTFSFE